MRSVVCVWGGVYALESSGLKLETVNQVEEWD